MIKLLSFTLAALATATLSSCAKVATTTSSIVTSQTTLPLVLSIGDSISIGYTAPLQAALKQRYNVYHVNDNCRNSYYNSINITKWLAEAPQVPSIVLWNAGIWNTQHTSATEPSQYRYTDVATYKAQLAATATAMLSDTKLQQAHTRIVFLTTTRIGASSQFYSGYEVQLNQAAREVLAPMGIEVVDLNSISLSMDALKVDEVHYLPEGSYMLSDYIVANVFQ